VVRWALREALGEREAHGRLLLGVLALAQGSGMPTHVWKAAASAAAGQSVAYADLGWVVKAAAEFLVEELDPAERSVYHLGHASYADELRPEAVPDAQRSIALALMDLKGCTGRESRHDWANADPYVLDHLATHAAAGGLLSELVTDRAYLAAADPIRLRRALDTDPALRDQIVPLLRSGT
jgi:hypothetical protein